ncbi:MAG: DNA polymerase III subunit beta [Candidatus Moranbacteria bacterium]|nr:DNA polymerase III subunit beta [Candidatus Moranbacteria bacterium]
MKLICTQENLRKAIAAAERAVGRQSTLPILGNFLLETENGRLKLSATNLEIGVIARVGAKIESDGRITIPAKLMSNFISNLPSGDTIVLESEGQSLKISSGGYQVKIKGLDAQEFPLIPQHHGTQFLNIPAQPLRATLAKLLPCVALNEARLELTGVNIIFSDNSMCLAATDSFRLAEETIALDSANVASVASSFPQGSCIIPAATFSEVSRVISPESKEVKLAFEDNQIFFEVDGVQILSRLVSGKFPDYKQIIPEQFALQATVSKEDLLRAVKIATVFTSQTSQEVVFRIDPEESHIVIESRSQEMGENQTILQADILSDIPLEMVFNPKYILDGINTIATSRIAILANESTAPAALKAVDEETGAHAGEYIYIIMPIRN